MNKSFKVVFSKARSALMVVNEATSSIQAKGPKTVIAAAAAAMIAGGAVAATTSIVKDAATLKDGTAYNSYTSDKASKTDNDFGALYVDGRGATTAVSGSAVNLSFTNNTSSGKAGALALDEASLTLRDAQFSNNSAAGWGGAVRLWGTSASRSALELKTTRDLTYAGNKAGQGKTAVSGGATALGDRYEDMGGFAHLQGNSTLTLNAAANTTLTIGETETHAVAGTFKGVENAGRVLVTGLDGMTVKAGTLTMIKDAIVKTNTGFIDFGKLAVDAKTVSGYDSTANTLTASGAATLDGMHLDQFKNTTVTDVSAPNTLNGSFGAVKLASGTASFTVADAKQVYLNNSGNLVVDKDGKLADVAVGNRSSFVTTGQNAVVGGVTGASGSFVVESGSLEAKGDVNVADLTVTGALTVNEKGSSCIVVGKKIKQLHWKAVV